MSARARILIIEDDHDIRELVRNRLVASGYDAHTARDGREGVTRIRQLKPDGVILDINMPCMDGFQVLSELADDPPSRMPRILMLSARHESGDVLRAVKLGAKDYLAKPFTDQQLLGRVARLMRAAPPAPPAASDALML